MPGKFQKIPRPLWLKERRAQNLLLGFAEQDIEQRGSTQHAYYYTHSAYAMPDAGCLVLEVGVEPTCPVKGAGF